MPRDGAPGADPLGLTRLIGLPRPMGGLMAALAASAGGLTAQANRTREGISHHSFAPYHRYRDMIDEHSALVETITNRAPRLARGDRELVAAFLLHAEREFFRATVRAALDYFFALSAISSLPLGTRELFERELDFLHGAQQRLAAPEHAGQLASELLMDLETAELILLEIMEKAPSLIRFDSGGIQRANGSVG